MPKKPSKNNHRGPIVGEAKGRTVIECKICGFKHVNPIPTAKEIDDFYKEFYTDEKPNYFADAEEDLEWWMAGYKNYYQLFEKYTKGRRLLDIGSGPGYFLKCGKDLGWDVTGVEPSIHAYKYSKSMGLKVVKGYFPADKTKLPGKFDVVTLSLVLEHVPDPKQFLIEAKSLLKPGGLLLILSPNEFSSVQKTVIESKHYKPWWIHPLEHINYFSFASIKKLLKKLDFKVVDVLATFPMGFFLLMGEKYIGNRKIGRKCHKMRKNFEINLYEKNPELLNSLYRSLAKNNIGREFVIIARKASN